MQSGDHQTESLPGTVSNDQSDDNQEATIMDGQIIADFLVRVLKTVKSAGG